MNIITNRVPGDREGNDRWRWLCLSSLSRMHIASTVQKSLKSYFAILNRRLVMSVPLSIYWLGLHLRFHWSSKPFRLELDTVGCGIFDRIWEIRSSTNSMLSHCKSKKVALEFFLSLFFLCCSAFHLPYFKRVPNFSLQLPLCIFYSTDFEHYVHMCGGENHRTRCLYDIFDHLRYN